MRRPILLAISILCLALAPSISARSHRHRAAGNSSSQPGQFDYYVLSLSWSPQYCAAAASGDPTQCGGRPFAFVVHGLWPQYNAGGWPQNCGGQQDVDPAIVNKMLAIMPSPRLVTHEWDTHGACSGLGQQDYFNTIQRAFGEVKIPAAYSDPQDYVMVAPTDLKQQFRAANPSIPPDGISLMCSGRYLSEVRICVDKNLSARSCGPDMRDRCSVDKAVLRPVRGGQ
ncbi:MAG: ribonuclease T2 family protein [Bryobacteraceae bacterium]